MCTVCLCVCARVTVGPWGNTLKLDLIDWIYSQRLMPYSSTANAPAHLPSLRTESEAALHGAHSRYEQFAPCRGLPVRCAAMST